jgi:hypothetical protein
VTRSIITQNPLLQVRDVYGGFFGLAFIFAAKSLKHTANQLEQWALELDLGVKKLCQLHTIDVLEYMPTVPWSFT